MQHNPPPPDTGTPASTEPIPFAEAIAIVAEQATAILCGPPVPPESCALSAALGRVSAAPVIADRDHPPFDRVMRDGFALRAADLDGGIPLQVVGEMRAGQPATLSPVQPGQAIEIMTGAALASGADAVLMVEHAEEVAHHPVRAIVARPGRTVRAGENFVPRGTEARRGDTVMEAGTRLRPEAIALAAACGLGSMPVWPVPSVAILATGDELVEPGTPSRTTAIAPHQIYNSNSYALAAMVQHAGAQPVRLPAAPDRMEDLCASIQKALQAAPLLLLTGGVSMGRYDLVEDALARFGAEFFFTGVRMQPGKPVVFGRVPASQGLPPRYFFGLPGNPVSSLVTFRAFVQPLLAALSGERNWQPRMALAILSSTVPGKPGLTRFVPAYLDANAPQPTVRPSGSRGSGDLASHVRSNGYIVVPEGCESLTAGHTVRVLLQG